MKGVVLCAGEGTRLRPRTYTTPKPLVEVNGQPLIEYAFEYARSVGVTELHLVVGYKRGQIIDKYGDSYRDLDIEYHIQSERNGLAHALRQVDADIENHFLVLLADVLYGEFPVEKLPTDQTALVTDRVPYSEASAYGVCETDQNGCVQTLVEKPNNPPSNQILAGSYVLPPEIFEYCQSVQPSSRGEYELTDAIASYLNDAENKAIVVEIESWRIDVADASDLRDAQRHLSRLEPLRVRPREEQLIP